LTWMVGVILFLIILAFALTGYLLPWDQKAYWATTVTINIARSTPLVGEWAANLLRGGADLGALTLLRWYAVHVFLLPAALIGFTLAHLYLMRRHRISGPITPTEGAPQPFYPNHALKDTLVIAVVFSALLALATFRPPELEAIADPLDTNYVPRPEWYFLALFQLLKYFPGPLEPLATIGIPGLIVLLLFLLPFLDRRPERHPLKRPGVTLGFGLLAIGTIALTYLAMHDSPERPASSGVGLLAVAGQQLVEDARCQQCHRAGGAGNPIGSTRPRRDPEWLAGHVADPEVIAPGIRPAPPGGMEEGEIRAVLAYAQVLRSGRAVPHTSRDVALAASVFARSCFFCHVIDGEGGTLGPDLSHIGGTRDAAWLRDWITDPARVTRDEDAGASMPGFGERLSEAEINAISIYLAARK
jgi:ubiquinol-cytochrome c reductase cytochrome b subunit